MCDLWLGVVMFYVYFRCVVIVSSEGNPSCARVLAAQLLLVVLTFRSNVNRNPLTTFFLQPSAPVWAMVFPYKKLH